MGLFSSHPLDRFRRFDSFPDPGRSRPSTESSVFFSSILHSSGKSCPASQLVTRFPPPTLLAEKATARQPNHVDGP